MDGCYGGLRDLRWWLSGCAAVYTPTTTATTTTTTTTTSSTTTSEPTTTTTTTTKTTITIITLTIVVVVVVIVVITIITATIVVVVVTAALVVAVVVVAGVVVAGVVATVVAAVVVVVVEWVDSSDLLPPPSLYSLISSAQPARPRGRGWIPVRVAGGHGGGLTRPLRLPSPCMGTRTGLQPISPEVRHGET